MAAKRYRLLLNVIDGLPSHSHYVAALADDDELAMASDEPRSRPPRLTEFSPEVAALAAAFDRLGELIGTLVAVNGGTPPKLEPYPRPVTAAERVRRRKRMEAHYDLVRRVLPHKYSS